MLASYLSDELASPLADRHQPASSKIATAGEVDTIVGSKLNSWFRAESAADFTFGTGSLVASWVNRAGNGNLVQATPALQPTFATSGFGVQSRPCVVGGGTQYMLGTLSTPLAINTRPYWIIAGKLNALPVSGTDTWFGSGTAVANQVFREGTTGVLVARSTLVGPVTETVTGPTLALGSAYVAEYGILASTTAKMWVNGFPFNGTTTTTLYEAHANISLFSTLPGTSVAEMSIAEIIVLNALPTAAELFQLRLLMARRGYY